MTRHVIQAAALALALAAGGGAALADDSINQENASMQIQRQMDYWSARGGYVLIQNQNAQAVGAPGANVVLPAPWLTLGLGTNYVIREPVGAVPVYVPY